MFEVSNVVAVGSRSKSRLATIVQWEEHSTNDPRFDVSNPFTRGIEKSCKKSFKIKARGIYKIGRLIN
jgi:hypothetical protein